MLSVSFIYLFDFALFVVFVWLPKSGQLNGQRNVLQITNALQKICKTIHKQKFTDKVPEANIKEIDFLKEQCQSPNGPVNLLSCQSLVHLVQGGVLQPAKILSMFISMLSNAR